jgi:hypothetical protein
MSARSPELNLIKLMWRILVQHLRRVPLTGRHMSERTALAVKDIMDEFMHSKVVSCYRKCNIFYNKRVYVSSLRLRHATCIE